MLRYGGIVIASLFSCGYSFLDLGHYWLPDIISANGGLFAGAALEPLKDFSRVSDLPKASAAVFLYSLAAIINFKLLLSNCF
jgi:hypothetical protein